MIFLPVLPGCTFLFFLFNKKYTNNKGKGKGKGKENILKFIITHLLAVPPKMIQQQATGPLPPGHPTHFNSPLIVKYIS